MDDDTHGRIPGYLGALTVFGTSDVVAVLAGRARSRDLPERSTLTEARCGRAGSAMILGCPK
jgi:hypothetical protein